MRSIYITFLAGVQLASTFVGIKEKSSMFAGIQITLKFIIIFLCILGRGTVVLSNFIELLLLVIDLTN